MVMTLGMALPALPVLGQDVDRAVPDDAAAAVAIQKVQKPYIVMMTADPAIAYDGGIGGYRATKPAANTKINPNSGKVKRYVSYLTGSHDDALKGIGVGVERKFADYSMSFNGFAAMLTGAEVAALSARDDVMMVFADEMRTVDTDVSPDYLGMEGVWDGGNGLLGEDIIIGVIDTGIWPENPSFSDQIDLGDDPGTKNGAKHQANLAYGPAPADWHGDCVSGEQFSQDDCNNKLIGARYFVDGFGKQKALFPQEYLSPRDWDGHGSHTASTAGGNVVDSPLGTIAGMAPRARIAMYKACWNSDPGGCANSDLVAAIDAAVADGVDVINYSIGSSAQTLASPDEISFLFAADAGVFVATSNGNDGPGPNTTGSPTSVPWLTSVGATNHRDWLGTATLGNGDVHDGASVADPAGTGLLPLVDASNHGNPLCYPEITFDPPITGNAVLCWRGDIARVDKSLAVYQQGGESMILANVPGGAGGTNADFHSVPSIHVDAAAGIAISAYEVAAAGSATVDIAGQAGGIGAVAGFSSRGLGASADLIKPDIAAPGVSVLAADAEVTFYGVNTDGVIHKSGTSMASPHIAGIGALVVEAHPDWSPAQVKSALMTTANAAATFSDDGVSPATPFDTGSGLVQPASALDPGLTYDAGFFDYVAFLCGNAPGVVSDSFCAFLDANGYPFDGSDLNQPNVAIGALAGSQTVTRWVTNVGPAGTYNVSIDAPAGINVSVSPASLTLAEGEVASFEVTFERTDAPLGVYAFGSFTWSHGPHNVTSQVAVRPVQASFPGAMSGEGVDGGLSFDIDFGYTGDYTAAAHGLVPAVMEDGNVIDDPANDINAALGTCDFSSFPYQCTGITWHLVEVPADGVYVQMSLFDDYTDGADDLDLYVWDPDGNFFGGSGSGTSAEQVAGLAAPGLYEVAVHGWQTDGADSNYTLFSWAFGADEGNMSVDAAPASAVLGGSGTVDVSWSGLTAGEMYLGAVSHSDGSIFGMTLIEINS
jgi:hypothetical protein